MSTDSSESCGFCGRVIPAGDVPQIHCDRIICATCFHEAHLAMNNYSFLKAIGSVLKFVGIGTAALGTVAAIGFPVFGGDRLIRVIGFIYGIAIALGGTLMAGIADCMLALRWIAVDLREIRRKQK